MFSGGRKERKRKKLPGPVRMIGPDGITKNRGVRNVPVFRRFYGKAPYGSEAKPASRAASSGI